MNELIWQNIISNIRNDILLHFWIDFTARKIYAQVLEQLKWRKNSQNGTL